jgi:hypothetical protein
MNRFKEISVYGTPPTHNILPVGKAELMHSNILPDIDLVRVGTESDGNCFFSAVLTGTQSGFITLKKPSRLTTIENLRVKCSNMITKYKDDILGGDFYTNLMNIRDYIEGTDDSGVNQDDSRSLSPDQLLGWFKTHIKTSKRYVSEEVYDLVAKVLEVNLFVLTEFGDELVRRRYSSPKTRSKFYNKSNPTIILLYIVNRESDLSGNYESVGHYESVGVLVEKDDLRFDLKQGNDICNFVIDTLFEANK